MIYNYNLLCKKKIFFYEAIPQFNYKGKELDLPRVGGLCNL